MPTEPFEDVIALALADKRGADMAGNVRVGRGTRKRAKSVIEALQIAGWVIVANNNDTRPALIDARAALLKCGYVGKGKHGSGDPEINKIDAALG